MSQQKIPELLVPILQRVVSRVPDRDVPLDFWTIDHGPLISDAFMDLSSELMLSGIDEGAVPEGYVMLTYLFDWEAGGQSDGWSPLQEASDDEFSRVLAYYLRVGLPGEAEALRRARAVAENSDDLDAISAAYDTVRHEYSVDLDRLEYLTQWFCDHAETLLYNSAV